MSLEQLIFIALFILVPLVRALAERRQKRRQAEEAEEFFETLANPEPPGRTGYDPPAWPMPTVPAPTRQPAPPFPPPRRPGAAPSSVQSLPTPSARPPAPEPARAPAAEPTRSLRTARARTRAAVPRNRAELRRALLLVEVLGPPRALDPRGR